MLIVAAAAAILPSCVPGKATIDLNNLKINRDQEDLLGSLTETIIPTTETPGAKEISAHLFTLKMVDDCYTAEEQKTFMQGFDEFNKMAETEYKDSFDDLSAAQKTEMLNRLEKGDQISEPLKSFYKSTKNLSILAYTTSKDYLTKIKKFSLIPGKYQGSVLVQTVKASA